MRMESVRAIAASAIFKITDARVRINGDRKRSLRVNRRHELPARTSSFGEVEQRKTKGERFIRVLHLHQPLSKLHATDEAALMKLSLRTSVVDVKTFQSLPAKTLTR
ncbi:uncharacterized protein LOC117605629 [Osmia lignaria lignaria]|uniref:uncharacterized protein LOC117605629 n=1 Tax=Osmia lignaria lignaria TaxID=1437193 RepID=UPI00147963EE|nr:uncharacterized protein LOC117605629 isoform X2 [Osmia lignaria]